MRVLFASATEFQYLGAVLPALEQRGYAFRKVGLDTLCGDGPRFLPASMRRYYHDRRMLQPYRDVIEEFAHEQEREFADLEYFHDLLLGIEKHVAELDRELGPYLDRPVDQVDPIERGVLRLAAYELLHRIDVPYRVVLNEAIETTKRFGADHGHTYVNGVLDRACASWREAEFRAARRRQ